ncbi:Zuotin [Microbotryomycetes sp. JL221]|nr:Zuotin [Microbotryomycetes sp. JL221]
MATIIQSSFELPAVPSGYKAPAFQPLSAPSTSKTLLPAGTSFFDHARRVVNQHTFEQDDEALAERAKNGQQDEVVEDVDAHLGTEQESRDLLRLDPKLWKEQDHYAVLGLQSLRYKATPEQIKKAHHRKVLRHHPDKKASAGGETNDDSFFKCIAKAMETLSNPEKRRQFDSVDPAIDDEDVPDVKDTSAENFYKLWTPVFEREGRFSTKQPVPALGGPDATKQEVESFYNFWYNIDSWRSFEYLDKDAPEGTDSRDEKRHQEKKNKSERARRKKEDNARVREIVDRALTLDPRMKAFKAAEKAARDAKKGGVKGGANGVDSKKAEEDKKRAEEEAKAKAAEEEKKAAEDKANREAAKKAKAAAAKNVKKDKKAISAVVTANNYFVEAGSSPSPSTVEGQLTELDLIFGALEPEEVGEMKKEIEAKTTPADMKAVIVSFAKKAEAKVGEGKFKEFA